MIFICKICTPHFADDTVHQPRPTVSDRPHWPNSIRHAASGPTVPVTALSSRRPPARRTDRRARVRPPSFPKRHGCSVAGTVSSRTVAQPP